MRVHLTLCIIHDQTRVLLGMKKRGFGVGRWNGFGGKVRDGESCVGAARREVEEEAGITPTGLVRAGTLLFQYEHTCTTHHVDVFRATAYTGIPCETDEMRPAWFPHDAIPYDDMWPDDRYWLPQVLAGRCIEGRFVFADEHTIVQQEVIEV